MSEDKHTEVMISTRKNYIIFIIKGEAYYKDFVSRLQEHKQDINFVKLFGSNLSTFELLYSIWQINIDDSLTQWHLSSL